MKAPSAFLLSVAFMAATILFGISIDISNSNGVIISLAGMAIVVSLALTQFGPKYREHVRKQANL